jgi:hypothetical protein
MASCKKEAQQYYEVKNNSVFPITVLCADKEEPANTDTTLIPVGQTLSVSLIRPGTGKAGKFKETGDRINNLTLLDIYRNGTVKSNRDFLVASRWTYAERDKYIAYYTLQVESTDF